jgi:hypothetical protein
MSSLPAATRLHSRASPMVSEQLVVNIAHLQTNGPAQGSCTVAVLFQEPAARPQAPLPEHTLSKAVNQIVSGDQLSFCRVPVAITVVIFLNDYSVPIPMFIAIMNDPTVVISIAVTVMPSVDC